MVQDIKSQCRLREEGLHMKVKLSQAFDLQMGKTPSRNVAEYWGGDHKWVSIADIGSAGKYISSTKECITDEGISGSGIKAVPKGTVIMSFKLSIGKTAIASEDMYTNEAIMAFIDKGVYPVDPNYLYHLCCGTNWTAGTNKAVMGLTLNKATLSEKAISLPTIQEQKEIAEKLDNVDVLINLRQCELAKLDELVKARFVEMFGDMLINDMMWPEIPLEQLADVVSGITKGRKVTDTELFEVPYMAVSNVKDGYIDWTTIKTILATQKEIEQYRLLPYDVLMTEGGDPDKLGRGAVIAKPLENSIHQNHIFRVRLQKEKILPAFFSEYLQHQKAKRYFLGCAKQTTGIASINMTQLRALPVLTPPMELQKQFIAFIEQTDKSKLAVQQSLERLETLKKSLMQQYFG